MKFKLKAVALIFCLLLAGSAAACGAESSLSSDFHLHSYGEWHQTSATCTEDGVRTRTCPECGAEQSERIPALGHEWEEETLQEAACEEAGRCAFVCKLCGSRENEREIPALGHEWREEILDEATCTEEGLLKRTCSRCKETETETIARKEHLWSEVRVLEEATCERAGVRSAVCKTCGLRENEQEIPALGHAWEELSEQAPSCTQAGEVQKRCTRCAKNVTEPLEATGHRLSERRVVKQPTCTEEGRSAKVCEVCGAEEDAQTVPKSAHAFGEWRTELSPTCTDAGEKSRRCEACGAEERESVSPLGHRFDTEFTIDEPPTAERGGSKSRHCLNDGCSAREEVTPLEPLKDETTYRVHLRTTTGGDLPSCVPKIDFYAENGEFVKTQYSFHAEVTLPTANYNVRVSGLPLGYRTYRDEYTLTPSVPETEIRIPASMIEQAPSTSTSYWVGSVLYDMEVDVVGLTPDEDETTTLKALFSGYKAVLLNMYFCTCSACVQEMPNFVAAYHTLTSEGTPYGEEVACVMLSYMEMRESIRSFKNRTNFKATSYAAEYEIPMIMLHSGWLTNYFTKNGKGMVNAFPTSILIDCEGVIVEAHTGYMQKSAFTQMMQRGIDRYRAICAWREEAGLGGPPREEVRIDLAPAFTTVKRRKP